MKARAVYFKVTEMDAATIFWEEFLNTKLTKHSTHWSEFDLGNIRLGFLLNDFGDVYTGARSAVMFEFSEEEFPAYITRAKENGATILSDNINNPALRSISLSDPFGNEFECGISGTHH